MNKTQKKHVYISIFAVLLFGFLFFQEPKIKDAAEAVRLGNYYFNGAGGDGFGKAEAGFTKAVEIDPKILWGHYQLARVYFVKGEKDRALEEINKELEVNPENLRSLYVRGLIYESSGKLAEAEADFKRFVLWAPKEWAGYNDLAWILAKESASMLPLKDWQDAYPGNNPEESARGLADFKLAIEENLKRSLPARASSVDSET